MALRSAGTQILAFENCQQWLGHPIELTHCGDLAEQQADVFRFIQQEDCKSSCWVVPTQPSGIDQRTFSGEGKRDVVEEFLNHR